MDRPLTVLGIESSCDDTAAAIVQVDQTGPKVKSNVVVNQTTLHSPFGGVVPEIAARAHAERLDHCVEDALSKAQQNLSQIDAIAVTAGPGLIGGVVSGVMLAKGLSAALEKPLIGVNHLAGHALTPQLSDGLAFPYLLLLVSGGHCQFLIVRGVEDYTRLGGTIDDAPGEAFDKTARLIGLSQPGGPSVELRARGGDPKRIPLPRPLLDRPGCDMSFSGLKTAVLRARDAMVTPDGSIAAQDQADLAAAFQAAVTDILSAKAKQALDIYLGESPARPAFAIAGGVAANQTIRTELEMLCQFAGVSFSAPPLSLCTDNAAMIAYAGALMYRAGITHDLTLSARPRWPLDQTAKPMIGSGKKGAKA